MICVPSILFDCQRVIETSEGQYPPISSDCTNLANTDLVPGLIDSVSDKT